MDSAPPLNWNSKFYIYDNGSEPPASTVLHKYMRADIVTYSTIPDGVNGSETAPQVAAYNECLTRYGISHSFIGFIDVDEFVNIGLRKANICSILDNYRDFGGLSLNWKIFCSSGHDHRPVGGVLQNYCTCEPGFNRLTKVFVNTAKVLSLEVIDPLCSYEGMHGKVLFIAGSHNVCYARRDLTSVSVSFEKVRGATHILNITAPVIFINHYITKSRADYRRKIERGRADLPIRRGTPLIDRT